MAQAIRVDDPENLDELTPLEMIQAMAVDFKERAETAFFKKLPLLNADDQNPSRVQVALDEKRDAESRKRELDENDEEGHAAADKEITAARKKLESIHSLAKEHTSEGACFRDYAKRFESFYRDHLKATYVLNPITPLANPSMERIQKLRLDDAELERADERLDDEPVPLPDALEDAASLVNRSHNAFNPSVYSFLSRHREDRFEWPRAATTNRALEVIPEPNGGEALCWLFPEEVTERLHAKIKAAYKARRTEGMSRAQINEARLKINRERLALQREEHSHVLGFEAQGMKVKWRPGLSIFVVFQFSVPAITRLRGKGTSFEEPW